MELSQAQKDDAYRALGRYFAEFSRLIFQMRVSVEYRLQRDGDPDALMQIAFGGATARGVADVFFGLCRALQDFDDEENWICKQLAERLTVANNDRNDMAHADWWIDWVSPVSTTPELIIPAYTRTKPAKGREQAWEPVSPEQLDAKSEDLIQFRYLLGEFGRVCLGQHPLQTSGRRPDLRLKDVLIRRGRHVRREGPAVYRRSRGRDGESGIVT